MSEHREWTKENTLTAPSDRDTNNKFRLDQSVPPLTDAQVVDAMKDLNITAFVERFPQVERRFADPPVDMQKIGLISFVPAKGSKPNEQGIYGFAKLRGNFATESEANEQAERIVRTVDSYHQIYHTYVGRPFPLTVSSDYSASVNRVDLQQATSDSISNAVREKREKEQREIEEIKNKEKELLDDVKKTEENRDDHYTTLRVKKAQLTWTYIETEKKLQQMCGLIARARHEIEELDEKYPELKDAYFNKYMEARKQAGLSTDRIDAGQNFIKYMVEDVAIPAIDKEYDRLYKD
jgi:gas vesicle protein